jgi:predicted alpha/beta-fold hydrolase
LGVDGTGTAKHTIDAMATVDVSGIKIHYEIAGDGPPIVLTHGLTGSLQDARGSRGWIDFLANSGRQVIGLDLRGHGSGCGMATSVAGRNSGNTIGRRRLNMAPISEVVRGLEQCAAAWNSYGR